MREIKAADISAAVAKMCVSGNTKLPADVRKKFEEGLANETTAAGKEIFRQLLVEAQVSGPLVMDAFLAALALENGATLVTTDRDFARFPNLKLRNPAAG